MGPAQLLEKRQTDDGDDLETDAATDPLRDAVNYRSIFSNQPTVTYSAVSTGAQPASAKLVATSTVSPGTNGVGSPPDTKEQGTALDVDPAFSLEFRISRLLYQDQRLRTLAQLTFSPYSQVSVASAFSGTFNLQGIPSRFNGFKQQVFTGRLKSNPNNPSDRTYPSDFGPALQKFLQDNEQDVYGVVDDVGEALSSNNVGNNSVIKTYFTAYAQNEYRSAIDFLSNWVGTSYTPGGGAAATSSATGNHATVAAPKTTAAANKPPSKTKKSPVAPATTTAKKSKASIAILMLR
ncbi:MAG: hypothetical protein LQ352_003183 [Teloschistes flavicans]|nr:MAG: hypothetical protein LQ352_003183 [Teloschistes flavicans]